MQIRDRRYILVIAFSIIAIQRLAFADPGVRSGISEQERLKILEEAQYAALRENIATESRARDSGSIPNYGNFMHSEIAPVFESVYGSKFAGSDLESLPSSDLQARFKAFEIAGGFRRSDSIRAHMLRITDELDKRGEVSQDVAGRMFGSLIRARDFDAARRFHSRFPDLRLEPVPEIIDTVSGPISTTRKTVWQVSDDGASLTRSELQLEGPQIVVFSSLGCAHSRRFMAELPEQEELSKIFGEHAIWIEPQDNDLHMKEVAEWNRQHPDQALQFMHSFEEWPEYKHWGTPSFYFVMDGKIVKSFSGWPNWSEVIDGVEQLGLAEVGVIQPPEQSEDSR